MRRNRTTRLLVRAPARRDGGSPGRIASPGGTPRDDLLQTGPSRIKKTSNKKMEITMKSILLAMIAVLTLSGAVAPSAHAAPPSLPEASRRVSVADLDLTRAADRDVALARVQEAARDVCRLHGVHLPLVTRVRMEERCARQTVVRALAGFGDRDLVHAFEARAGRGAFG
jgi:UrcA family protein